MQRLTVALRDEKDHRNVNRPIDYADSVLSREIPKKWRREDGASSPPERRVWGLVLSTEGKIHSGEILKVILGFVIAGPAS